MPASTYPNLRTSVRPDVAVKAFLVTYEFQLTDTERHLRLFARSLCQNFSTLQEKGHPKWREVDLALPELGRGWFYFAATARELRTCIAGESLRGQPSKARPAKLCSQQERILGLCK